MHRSGTSACTRVLNLSGVNLGQDLMPAAAGNEKGFFEDVQAVAINDRILSAMGAVWYSRFFLQPHRLSQVVKAGFEAEIIDLLQDRLRDVSTFGLKDPRLCHTLPLWQQAADKLGVRIHYVMIYRNPLEVAASLKKRDGLEYEDSVKLWAIYNLSALDALQGQKKMLMSYDSMLKDPLALVKDIKQTFGSWGMSLQGIQGIQESVQSFLTPDLRHSNYSIDDLKRDPQWHLAADLYGYLDGTLTGLDLDQHFGEFKKENLLRVDRLFISSIKKWLIKCIPLVKVRRHLRKQHQRRIG